MNRKVLIVEDDVITMKILSSVLEKHGFSIISTSLGKDALSYLQEQKFHVLILDLNLPDMNGLELLKHIRSNSVLDSLAIIIVTNNDDKVETILGLEMGADDYITKPFHQRELIARLNAILRRIYPVETGPYPTLVYDNLEINIEKRLVKIDGKIVNLSFKEFEILILLASNPGKIIPREAILNKIGGSDYTPETRTVDVHISSIRKKLGDIGKVKNVIDTVSGVGYRFRE